ncbi:hypothetical protein ACFQE1_05170 [Halobium palmae]|uniref:Uncharacterized protein n=1 Tax=Halobium palmae TaxID=1776492 RepID=A0ABD5RXV4_9EURY
MFHEPELGIGAEMHSEIEDIDVHVACVKDNGMVVFGDENGREWRLPTSVAQAMLGTELREQLRDDVDKGENDTVVVAVDSDAIGPLRVEWSDN